MELISECSTLHSLGCENLKSNEMRVQLSENEGSALLRNVGELLRPTRLMLTAMGTLDQSGEVFVFSCGLRHGFLDKMTKLQDVLL